MFLCNEINESIHFYPNAVRLAERFFSGQIDQPMYPDVISLYRTIKAWADNEGRPYTQEEIPDKDMEIIRNYEKMFLDYFIKNQEEYLCYGGVLRKRKTTDIDLYHFAELAETVGNLSGASGEWKDYKNFLH